MTLTATVKVAEYLFRRLKQLGVDSVHGVPGDYNLTLLDYVEPAGLLWVGNANELNAGYATDGYARIKGLGALVTTFGVGELSAMNAIAGAYAERVPVVHIVGVPGRPTQDDRVRVHHTFNDGNFTRFSEMARHVTVAQTKLWDPQTSAEQVDWILQQAIIHSRPVYIEVPVDVVDLVISSQRLEQEFTLPTPVSGASFDSTVEGVLSRISASKQPVILVDGEIRAMKVVEDVQRISKTTNWPTWITCFSKGMLDETLPNFHGIYRGVHDVAETQTFIRDADLILYFGSHPSTTNTFFSSSIPDTQKTIAFSDTTVKIGPVTVRDVPAGRILPIIADALAESKSEVYKEYPKLAKDQLFSFSQVSKDEPIVQDSAWRLMGNFFKPGDIVMAETGTSGYGVRHLPLPQGAKFFGPVTWLSIGYMLPAAQGAALAQRELAKSTGAPQARTVLFIGDGSLQMTVQELSTMIQHDLDVVVFVINNDGYTIERCIHGLGQKYNDVARWRYLHAPKLFGAAEDSFTARAETNGELEKVLSDPKLVEGTGLRMVEVIMDREDAPAGPLMHLLESQRKRQ
ncbi:thiamine diphosphate-binding protein [Plectosphaerella plurivora]|uniref:Pyruvate decarboxylase n=1 Tax=Plectosphaerella plurivora TaxID=936078 RepID=A0A9P8V7N0_9PEZI|nr:thiamine diphosphate-binding protein [Plectosphaerella plurivora]